MHHLRLNTFRVPVMIALFICATTGTAGDADQCAPRIKKAIAAANAVRGSSAELVTRLHGFAAWLKEKETPCSTMVAAIGERIATLHDTTSYTIDTGCVTFVGDVAAPHSLILYISATCPLCKRIYYALYDSVTTGSLKGKARLGIKPFSSKPWDVALLAARDFGKQADLLRSLHGVTVRITLPIIIAKADSIGIPRKPFIEKINSEWMQTAALASYEEGVRNGVLTTPTIFINNHRYKSYKDPRWVIDAIEYRYKKAKP